MNTDLYTEKERLVLAIQSFDTEELSSLITNGVDIKQLLDNKKFFWHLQRNFFPEAKNLKGFTDDEREHIEELSERLSNGNEILKVLAQAGLFIPEVGEDYAQYSLWDLEENYFGEDEDISKYNQSSVITFERFAYSGARNPEGALWQAVSPEVLKIMLAQGADVNLKDSSGWTALHHIALAPKGKYFRPAEMIKILIEAGADVNPLSNDKITPLMLAIHGLAENMIPSSYDDYYTNNIKVIGFLMKHGADTKALDKYGHDIQYWSDKKPSRQVLDTFESFMEEIKAYPHMSDDEFSLMVAAFSGDINTLKEIIARNPYVNINFQTISGYTLLMFALQNKNVDVIKFLLEHGANPNLQNMYGETALFYAVRTVCMPDKIEILLKNGADPNIKDICKHTALVNIFNDAEGCGFISDRYLRIVKHLLDYGAKPDIADMDGVTPLMRCVSLKDCEGFDGNNILEMKLLIDSGADVNARDCNGDTPLMYAARVKDKSQVNVIKSLLSNGADPMMRNDEGESAIEILLDSYWGDEDISRGISVHLSPEDFITRDDAN